MLKTKWIKFIVISLFIAGLIIVKPSLQKRQTFQATDAYEPCLPKVDNKIIFEREYLGFIDKKNKKYYIFKVLEKTTDPYIEDLTYKQETVTVVSVDEIGCYVELAIEDYGKVTLEKYFSQTLAREIALMILKNKVDQAGGISAYMQKRIDDSFGEDYGEPEIFFPEVLWAWNELKLPIPKEYEIIRDIKELDAVSPWDE